MFDPGAAPSFAPSSIQSSTPSSTPPAPHRSPLLHPTPAPSKGRPTPTDRQRDAFNHPEIGRSTVTLCSGTTLEGKPCRFAARHETGLCINHDPAYREQQRQNTLRGAHASMARRDDIAARVAEIDRQLLEPDPISLDTRAGIQALLETVLRLELAGSLSLARARIVTRMLSIASQNFERIPQRSGAVYTSSHYDPESFEHRRQALARLFPTPANLPLNSPSPAEREKEPGDEGALL